MSSHLYQYDKINDKSKQFAIDNLNENPSQVNAHIESFRRWVKSMPHLNCPTDSEFLLRFLRVAKFDHKKAEKRLDNFCTNRSSVRGCPEFFQQIDESIIDEFLDSGTQIPLGRNDDGEQIVLIIAKSWNYERVDLLQSMIILYMLVDILVAEEDTQIHGVKVWLDFEGCSRKSIEACSDTKILKNLLRITQDSYPIRLKGVIFSNEPPLFEIFFNILYFFMNDKIKSRVLRVKNDFSKILDKNPGIDKILPTEYGGLAGSVSECAERWKIKFKNYFKNGNPLSSVSADESNRPQETLKYLTEYADYKGQTFGIAGSYTKYDDIY